MLQKTRTEASGKIENQQTLMNWAVFWITVEVLYASLTMSSLNAIALWNHSLIKQKEQTYCFFAKHSIKHLFMCKLSW